MKKTTKKLQLKNDTVRRLETTELVRVAGGANVPTVLNTHCASCLSICTGDPIDG